MKSITILIFSILFVYSCATTEPKIVELPKKEEPIKREIEVKTNVDGRDIVEKAFNPACADMKNGKICSHCPESIDNIKSQSIVSNEKKNTYSIYIMDQSGSMNIPMEKSNRMEIAKRIVKDYVLKLKSKTNHTEVENFGLYLYGAENNGCFCMNELQTPYKNQKKTELVQNIHSLKAEGVTPIANSIRLVKETIAQSKGIFNITLITDGMETCGGDPKKEAMELAKLNSADRTIVFTMIGIGLSEQSEQELRKVIRVIPTSTEKGLRHAFFNIPIPYMDNFREDLNTKRLELYYGMGKTSLNTENQSLLANFINGIGVDSITGVRIEGFACASGSESMNLSLSKTRTNGVKTYLKKLGINTKNVYDKNWGESISSQDLIFAQKGNPKDRKVIIKVNQK